LENKFSKENLLPNCASTAGIMNKPRIRHNTTTIVNVLFIFKKEEDLKFNNFNILIELKL
jgi:hypothetical protein